MIDTVQIKHEQLWNGYLQRGSGEINVFIMGSCRVCPYINYLHEWNEANDSPFTIRSLDPFNNHWNRNDERVDYEMEINKLETNGKLLGMLWKTDIFLHEYYANFGMFNCDKNAEKNIYQFGMHPVIDVCIPSWNDLFVLFADICSFDVSMKKMALQDFNVLGKLSEQTQMAIMDVSQDNIRKFLNVCQLSDLPEMADFFRNNFIKKRLWHTYNHVTKAFTLGAFKLMNEKYLKLDLSKGFNEYHEDMFRHHYTPLTEYDVKHYSFEWKEEIVFLKDKI